VIRSSVVSCDSTDDQIALVESGTSAIPTNPYRAVIHRLMHQSSSPHNDAFACSVPAEWLTFTLVVHRVSLPTSNSLLWIMGRSSRLV
jgi:hypothetical protein